MAEFASREVHTLRVEYYLPSPSAGGELGKAWAAITANAREDGLELADDTITVEARDDEIVLWYEK